jgi:uncharacterized protein with PIN domain
MRFLVDAMLGNLARWLRLFGHDALFANDLINPGEEGLSDKDLGKVAQEQGRILITRDKEFAKRVPESIFVPGTDNVENLKIVQQFLNTPLSFNQDLARCTNCNASLVRITDKTTVKDLVPTKTFARYDDYWKCSNPNCAKVFWQGSHFEDIRALEKQLKTS